MQYSVFLSPLLLSGAFAAQDFSNVRAKDVIDLEFTMSSIPHPMMQKISELPEQMMQHQLKTMKFIGIAEIAAGAAMMHRGMNLLQFEVAMYHDLHANTTAAQNAPRPDGPPGPPPAAEMPRFDEDEMNAGGQTKSGPAEVVDPKPEIVEGKPGMQNMKRDAGDDEEEEPVQ